MIERIILALFFEEKPLQDFFCHLQMKKIKNEKKSVRTPLTNALARIRTINIILLFVSLLSLFIKSKTTFGFIINQTLPKFKFLQKFICDKEILLKCAFYICVFNNSEHF